MLLLNLSDGHILSICSSIYIPLCFYLIQRQGLHCPVVLLIYIPLCFYLIVKDKVAEAESISYLHSTMLLLNQYLERKSQQYGIHLHSTMLLLNPDNPEHFSFFIFIYIPLCFYLIDLPPDC